LDSSGQPRLIDDVGVWLFYDRGSLGDGTYIVGSLTTDRYVIVPESKLPAVRAFMLQLDGRRTLDEVYQELVREHGVELDVRALYRKFRRAGLLTGDGDCSGGDIEEMSTTFLRLPINGLLRFFQMISRLANLLLYVGLGLISAAMVLLLGDQSFLHGQAKAANPYDSAFRNAGLTGAIVALSALLHELSHCFAAARCGIHTGTLRIQLYLGMVPIIGLKLTGLYTLPPRQRLAIWSAGIFANLSTAAAAMVISKTVLPVSPALELAVTVNWLLAMFNLMPLLPTDGYFILSTLVKDSNVRMRAWNWLRHPLRPRTQRPSWFVLTYIVSTVCLLLSSLRYFAVRIVNPGSNYPLWQSALSLFLLALFIATLWRTFRWKGESN
jgi:Zn-dependent protease